MKRIYLILVILCSAILVGCTSESIEQTDEEIPTIDGGTVIYLDDSGDIYSMDQIPFDIPYDGKKLHVSYLKCFQHEQDFEIYGYVVVAIDISELDEREKHWFYEEETLTVGAMFCGGKNEFEYEHLQTLKPAEYEGILYYLIRTNKTDHGYKEFLDETEVSLNIRVKQDDIYEFTTDDGRTGTCKKENTYMYDEVISKDIGNLEDMVAYLGDAFSLIDIGY